MSELILGFLLYCKKKIFYWSFEEIIEKNEESMAKK
jgi:hypothetical protein